MQCLLFEPGELVPELGRPAPEAFAAIVKRAIAKDRDERYQRMGDLLHELKVLRGQIDSEETGQSI